MSKRLDERLRRAARTCRELRKYTTENMFLEASGTICKLRDDLQRANAENAKLRELVMDMCVWAYIDSNCDLEDRFSDRMRELGIEVGE